MILLSSLAPLAALTFLHSKLSGETPPSQTAQILHRRVTGKNELQEKQMYKDIIC